MNPRHSGNWKPVGKLVTDYPISLDVYECPICFALTREPGDHLDHHERYGTTRVGVEL